MLSISSDLDNYTFSSNPPFDFVGLSDSESSYDNSELVVSEFWARKQLGGKYKWTTLEHNGVLFPPEYIKHGVPVIYKGKQIILNKLEEEYATLYAKYLETEYVQ